MAEKDRKKFFDKLEEHSRVKLQVLTNYIKVWIRKILLNHHGSGSCLIVDTFAGVGKYKDGSLGSPLIIINETINCIEQVKRLGFKN